MPRKAVPYTSRSAGANGPAGDPLLADRGYLYPDNAHQPSLAYIPYLLTGDRYDADQVAAWADFGLLSTFQDSTTPTCETAPPLTSSMTMAPVAANTRANIPTNSAACALLVLPSRNLVRG